MTNFFHWVLGADFTDKKEEDFHLETGIYIPKLHGLKWYEWYEKYGCKNMKEIVAKAEELAEKRIDVIGSNGNEGLHYCPDQKKGEE